MENYEADSLIITNINLGTIDQETSLKLFLNVNDRKNNSSQNQVNINVRPLSKNYKPEANAGFDQSKNKGEPVILNGSASSDSTNTGIIILSVLSLKRSRKARR